MSEINYLETIQNKLDALVEKIIQKENSDENFRITYAQILEKINTKMDVFSSNENFDKIGLISIEIRNLLKDRQLVVDGKFNAIKGEFDNLNEILLNSLKTPEFLAAFNKIQNQIQFFAEEQENQKETFNSIISHIEKFGTLEETNDIARSNFAIIKEQNTIINENINKQLNLFNTLNSEISESNKKSFDELNSIVLGLNELKETFTEDNKEIQDILSNKVDDIISKIHETDSFVEILNNNLTTLIQVIGNIFEDEEFKILSSDVADILTKTAFLSETVKTLATKEDLDNKNQELLTQIEEKILAKLDFSDLQSIKDYTEKMFFQGTEVLKDEIWSIKDTVAEVQKNTLSTEAFNEKIIEIKNNITEDITDTISTESVATANQISEISSTIENLRKELSEIILNEQNEQITSALNDLQTKFVSQLVQIADNISFEEESDEINENIYNSSEEIKEKISSNISDIKDEILQLKDVSSEFDGTIISLLEKIEDAVKTDINKDLKTLISGFSLLTSGLKEDKDYVYTLPDIESDLSKIRLDLTNLHKVLINTDAENTETASDITTKINQIQETLQKVENSPINSDISEIKGLFTTLNEDVSSISKRTNKLILTSDEINKTLKSNIEVFSSLIKTFEKQSKEFYNSSFVNNLDTKIDNITQTTTSLVQSDKVLNEAFMYLAEWIDTASESFELIKEDVTAVKNDIINNDSTISDRIDSIEDKVDKIVSQKNDTKELKSLVEYIASQVSITNEKIIENEKLAQRITNMEKQLKKIEHNIAVITEYIDEDEENDFEEDE